jgi:dTMP kinase
MRFIAFEGVDGAGKSTLMARLGRELTSHRIRFITTREPGGSELAENIRKMLLSTTTEAPVPRAELLLYQAARAQHVERTIRPALASGLWVLCDRFIASSLAFQSGGRGLREDHVRWLNAYAVDGCEPHATILIDLSVEQSVERKRAQRSTAGETLDRFEREKADFHARVREHYLQQFRAAQDWLCLDGAQPTDELVRQVVEEWRHRGWL